VRAQGAQPLLWRVHAALGSLYRATARPEEAEREFLAARTIIEELAANRPLQRTWLSCLDCRRLGLDKLALERLMREEAGVYLDEGYIFGPEGEGFERINIACPRSVLAEGLDRIRRAVEQLPAVSRVMKP